MEASKTITESKRLLINIHLLENVIKRNQSSPRKSVRMLIADWEAAEFEEL